jgi:hypothetical protein
MPGLRSAADHDRRRRRPLLLATPVSEPVDLRRYRRARAAIHGDIGPAEPAGSFVCTACGTTKPTKAELQKHWDTDPICKASLTRPVGNFGAKKREHCPACHPMVDRPQLDQSAGCLEHAYRGCPAC